MGVNYLCLDQQTKLQNYLDQVFSSLSDQNSFDRNTAAWDTVLGNVEIAVALWFLGLTVIGLPLIVLIILARGFILGFTVSFLARQKSLEGTVLIALGIFPQNLLYIPALLVGGVLAISFSLYLIKGRFSVTSALWTKFMLYTLLMLLVTLVLIFAGLIEGFAAPSFLRLLVPLISFKS